MPSDEIPVAAAQFAPGTDKAANLDAIRSLAQRAVDRGAQLVVFPEYSSFFTPELGARAVAAAESLDGPFVAALARIAGNVGATIVAGMLEATRTPDRFANTLIAVSRSGEVLAKYRKIHLYDAFGQRESDSVLAGDIERPETFSVGGFTAGLQTCYDLRFPESTRRLVDAGVDLVLVPSEWVRGPLKEAHWRLLVTARAVENTVYVVAADQAPPIGAGNSMIVDPMGVELATVGENTDVALGWASPARLAEVRAINPALALRRFAVVAR
ncbi:carbon-nitrogen hydrolase family protein [Parafrigoribacterium mesophilum]|uniref:carbon-nitrogen hydrolase family protein n=1 Tax=Parafrigoribacterium mesophilum TaxID=433646 RepID=UPI0031FBF783